MINNSHTINNHCLQAGIEDHILHRIPLSGNFAAREKTKADEANLVTIAFDFAAGIKVVAGRVEDIYPYRSLGREGCIVRVLPATRIEATLKNGDMTYVEVHPNLSLTCKQITTVNDDLFAVNNLVKTEPASRVVLPPKRRI